MSIETTQMKSVYSTVADQIGYDEEEQVFYVRWARTGRLSAYHGVASRAAQDVLTSPSVGSAITDILKSGYDHEYVQG